MSVAAGAQVSEVTLVGVVKDPSGAVVVGAHVSLTNTDTRIVRYSDSNEAGVYDFTSISPGNYELAVERSGFRRKTISSIDLRVGESTRRDVALDWSFALLGVG